MTNTFIVVHEMLRLVNTKEAAKECYRVMLASDYSCADGFDTCAQALFDSHIRSQLEDVIGAGKMMLFYIYSEQIDVICFIAAHNHIVTILHFWISPNKRHQGYGTYIFSNFEKYLYSAGAHTIVLTSLSDTVYFWLKLGFSTEHNPETTDGCYMIKNRCQDKFTKPRSLNGFP